MEDYKKQTINSYNRDAQWHAEKFKGLLDLNKRPEFQKFINLLRGKCILDVGCGGGDHSLYFKSQGLKPYCIDLSEEMIKLCKEKGLKSEVMDMENLDFKKETFEGIWAVTSLLHAPKSKMRKVANDLHKILKQDGILNVCVKEGEGESYDQKERFFSYWYEEELLDYFNNKFDLIEFWKVSQGGFIYLHFLFKKSKSF